MRHKSRMLAKPVVWNRTHLRRIVYISTATDLTEHDVARILDTASRRNARDKVSGFLLYNGRNFLQLIEGDQAALMNLMARLARDTRHSGMSILVDEPIDVRCCPDWQMHRLKLADDVATRRETLETDLPAALSVYPRQLVQNFAVLN